MASRRGRAALIGQYDVPASAARLGDCRRICVAGPSLYAWGDIGICSRDQESRVEASGENIGDNSSRPNYLGWGIIHLLC